MSLVIGVLHKARDRWKALGAKGFLTAAAEEARRRVSELRTVLVLRVDLTDPKNRLRRERDKKSGEVELRPFDRRSLAGVITMVERHEPARARGVRQRLIEGARGFVAASNGELVGYVFWTDGTDHPTRLVHSDLRWLGIRPTRGEIYVFDYFLIEPARGLGNLFARTVQEEHFRMGYTAAYGWVLSTNRAALWLYRTTGWTEVARISERRFFSRIAVVGPTIYWMHALSRSPMLKLPFSVLHRSRP